MLSNLFEEINIYTGKFNRKTKFRKSGQGFGEIDSTGAYESKIKNGRFEVVNESWNLLIVTISVILIILIFVIRSVDIQLLKKYEYLSLSKTNRLREYSIQAERGVIFSSDDQTIARNKPAFGIQLNTRICSPDFVDFSECISVIDSLKSFPELEIDYERVKKDILAKKELIVVQGAIEKEKILSLEANINSLTGLVVVVEPVRDYVFAEKFAHVVGYIGLDESDLRPKYTGKTGLEKIYDNQLSGIPGTEIVQIDSAGLNKKIISKEDSLPGKNIETFLHAGLQDKAYEILKDKIINGKPDPETGFKAEAGAIIAQDPGTGGVLALVSYPSYDPNILVKGITNDDYQKLISEQNYPFYNRAVGAAYPPGSTFKMVPASAALMEKTITPLTLINDPGYLQVGSYIFRNWNTSGHGNVNLKRAIQVSNDTFFYTIGGGHGAVEGLGIERLHDWAVKFGFGHGTGIDLDGEVIGFMPDGKGKEWYLGNTYITAIGQGDVLATPLQVNNMVAYFANGGYLMKPKIVKKIDGVDEFEVEIISQNLVDKDYYELIREGMNAAVEPGGTGYPLFDFPIRHRGIKLAGKTGTAEYIDSKGNPRTHAWFSVFGPFEDAEIVLTVFLEGGGGGSDDAAPIAKELLDYWFDGR